MSNPLAISWKINNGNGKLPTVYEVPRSNGEASSFKASIRCEDGRIFRIDFGYGHESDETCANIIGAATELLAACMVASEALELSASGKDRVIAKTKLDVAIAKATGGQL